MIGLKIGEGLKLVDVDMVGLKILDHWFDLSFGSLGFKSQIVVILCLDCWVIAEDRLMGLCLCLCLFSCWFLGMCFLFYVWLTREINCWVCVCVLTGDRFVFLCLADKRDLLLGLCLCSCWRPVCVFVFG